MKYALCVKLCQHNFTIVIAFSPEALDVHGLIKHNRFFFVVLSKSLLFDRKYLMSFIIERHFWPPFGFFGDVIDNKKTSVSLHGWDRPRGNQSCPLGPILGHEKWKFQGDVDHHLCCFAFSLCLISLLYS